MTYEVEQNEPRFIHEDSIISGTLHIPKRFTIRNRDALFIYRYKYYVDTLFNFARVNFCEIRV